MQKSTKLLCAANILLLLFLFSFPFILKHNSKQNQSGYINPKDYYRDKSRFREITDPSRINLGNDEPPKDNLDRRWQKQNQAINDINLSYLQAIPKQILTHSVLVNTLVGTVYAIDTKGGIMKEYRFQNSYKFAAAIVIRNEIGEPNGFVFNTDQLKSLTVLDRRTAQKKHLSLSDLQPGESVHITETLNLTYPLATSRQSTLIELL